MIDTRSEVDAAGQIPNFLQGVGVINGLAVSPLHHDGDGERVAKIRMVLIDLDKRMIFGKQIGKDGLELDVTQPHPKNAVMASMTSRDAHTWCITNSEIRWRNVFKRSP